MNTLSSSFFYLVADTDHDVHDTACCCGSPSQLLHWATGASIYKLDMEGLQALNDFQMGDEDNFDKWLGEQEAQGTYYGSSKDAAINAAIQHAREEGQLLINHPEHFPYILPLAAALRGVVGFGCFENDGYLPESACECDSTQTRNQTVCRVCYARLICNILYTYIYNHIRSCERSGNRY